MCSLQSIEYNCDNSNECIYQCHWKIYNNSIITCTHNNNIDLITVDYGECNSIDYNEFDVIKCYSNKYCDDILININVKNKYYKQSVMYYLIAIITGISCFISFLCILRYIFSNKKEYKPSKSNKKRIKIIQKRLRSKQKFDYIWSYWFRNSIITLNDDIKNIVYQYYKRNKHKIRNIKTQDYNMSTSIAFKSVNNNEPKYHGLTPNKHYKNGTTTTIEFRYDDMFTDTPITPKSLTYPTPSYLRRKSSVIYSINESMNGIHGDIRETKLDIPSTIYDEDINSSGLVISRMESDIDIESSKNPCNTVIMTTSNINNKHYKPVLSFSDGKTNKNSSHSPQHKKLDKQINSTQKSAKLEYLFYDNNNIPSSKSTTLIYSHNSTNGDANIITSSKFDRNFYFV